MSNHKASVHSCRYQGATAASQLAFDASRSKRPDAFKPLIVQFRAACNACHASFMKSEWRDWAVQREPDATAWTYGRSSLMVLVTRRRERQGVSKVRRALPDAWREV